MRYLYELLAVVATFNIVGRVQTHSGPIIACGECPISKVASPGMVFVFSLVEFG